MYGNLFLIIHYLRQYIMLMFLHFNWSISSILKLGIASNEKFKTKINGIMILLIILIISDEIIINSQINETISPWYKNKDLINFS